MSAYTIPVPDDVVVMIEYRVRDELASSVLDLIAEHPTREGRDALVAAARRINPHAIITGDGIAVAPDDCFTAGILRPEHDYSAYGGTQCRWCGAEIPDEF